MYVCIVFKIDTQAVYLCVHVHVLVHVHIYIITSWQMFYVNNNNNNNNNNNINNNNDQYNSKRISLCSFVSLHKKYACTLCVCVLMYKLKLTQLKARTPTHVCTCAVEISEDWRVRARGKRLVMTISHRAVPRGRVWRQHEVWNDCRRMMTYDHDVVIWLFPVCWRAVPPDGRRRPTPVAATRHIHTHWMNINTRGQKGFWQHQITTHLHNHTQYTDHNHYHTPTRVAFCSWLSCLVCCALKFSISAG